MNFYGHEFFRTVSDSCSRVAFISGNENHKSHDNYFFIFSMPVKPFYGFQEKLFETFTKLQWKTA